MKLKLLAISFSIIAFQSYSQEFKKTQDKTGLVAEDQYNGTNINVGIGVAYPTSRFEVSGPIKLHSSAKLDSIFSIGNTFNLNGLNGNFKNAAWITNNISNRILITDAMGNISPLAVGTANQVLFGNGSWGNLPSNTASWNIVGNNLVNSNSGYIGIGNSNPQYLLDVNGDAHISNNLYVDGKILISDRVESGIVRSDSIVMDSATVIIGDPTIGGDITAKSKLDVLGNARFSGQLTASQGVLFDNANNIGIKFQSGSNPGSGTFVFGKSPLSPLPACVALPGSANTFQLGGNAQIWDPNNNTNPGLLNLQTWAGGSSIDASSGGTTSIGALLLNFFCGSNTSINTGVNGGSVYVGKEFYADRNSQIGANSVAINPNVALNIFENSTTELLKFNSSTNTTKLIASNNGQFEVYGDGRTKIGPGPNSPYKTLTVNGDVAFANYGNSNNGLNAFEILGNAQIPTRRGISLENDPNGKINFYLHGWQTNSSFNFKNADGDKNLLSIDAFGGVLMEHRGGSGYAILLKNMVTANPKNILFSVDAATGNTHIGGSVPINNYVNAKLTVDGLLLAREIKVSMHNQVWADYVFEKDYVLTPLREVEKYIIKNKHLEGIPSAAEVSEKGVDVVEMNAKLLEKVEELFLYNIQLEKEIQELKKLINSK